jgi:hypothetical protein
MPHNSPRSGLSFSPSLVAAACQPDERQHPDEQIDDILLQQGIQGHSSSMSLLKSQHAPQNIQQPHKAAPRTSFVQHASLSGTQGKLIG